MKQKNNGFTLIELLIAMAILGILSTIALGSFQSSQLRGRDAERKSDLKQISNAVELFYQDYGTYPLVSETKIAACPYNPNTSPATGTACDWGTSEFRDIDVNGDTKTTYMKTVPKDPGGTNYVYQVSASGKSYRLFARLENTQDKNINAGISVSCGTAGNCNFSITSTNATPTGTLP